MADQNNQSGDLGNLVLPPDSASTGSAPPDAGVSASAQVIKERKQRSDKGQPRGPRGASATGGVQAIPPNAITMQQFEKLYSPALWEKAICAPADAMQAITGNAHWEISAKEREAVGASCSIAAQCFAVTDPRWLAASLAIVTVLDVYGIRLAMELQLRAQKREEEKKKKSDMSGFRQQ